MGEVSTISPKNSTQISDNEEKEWTEKNDR